VIVTINVMELLDSDASGSYSWDFRFESWLGTGCLILGSSWISCYPNNISSKSLQICNDRSHHQPFWFMFQCHFTTSHSTLMNLIIQWHDIVVILIFYIQRVPSSNLGWIPVMI